MYKENYLGFGLAAASSAFIGSSFIIKKKGLQRAGASGSRAGTAVLHSTRDPDLPPPDLYTSIPPQISWHVHANGEIWKKTDNDELHHEFVGIIRPDYFK